MRHRQQIPRGSAIAMFGEVASEHQVVLATVAHPEPALFSVAAKLSFVGIETRLSPWFLRDFNERSAFGGKEKSGFVMPAGDGVVGDFDLVKVGHDFGNLGCRVAFADGEVEREGDGSRGEFHFVPVKNGVDFSGDEFDFLRVGNEGKSFFVAEWQIDFVCAFLFFGGVVV